MSVSGVSSNMADGASGNAGNFGNSNFQQQAGGFMNAAGGFQGMLSPSAMAGLQVLPGSFQGGLGGGLGGGFHGGLGGGNMSDFLAMQYAGDIMDSNKRRKLQEMTNSQSSS
jgi:hypothetical protein